MPNFWDSINTNKTNNGFNMQQFMKFYNENKGNDMNQVLNNMVQSGQVTQEQLNNATNQAQGILQMLRNLGMLK